jgi:FMNH2-dependent dimethyl sulfone monooxygenase
VSDGLGDRTASSPADFADSPFSRVLRQPLILGLFLPVQNGGWSASLLPRTTDWSFGYNAALTRRAEELGFDLVFGLAQWTSKGGYGGTSKYREDSLDPFITVTALSAITDRILLISTIHVLFGPWHPLHLAKFGATIDHISGGRWGINVVTGYAPSEARMFGGRQIEHDRRYEMAAEFTDILNRLWGEAEDLTLQGKFWSVEKAFVTPKPRYGRPILVNATGSPAGIDYAAAHSDLVFITSPAGHEIDAALAALPAHNAVIKAAGAARGRELRTIINPMIVCRETDHEARQYHKAILDAADRGAVAGFVAHQRSGGACRLEKAHGDTHRALGQLERQPVARMLGCDRFPARDGAGDPGGERRHMLGFARRHADWLCRNQDRQPARCRLLPRHGAMDHRGICQRDHLYRRGRRRHGGVQPLQHGRLDHRSDRGLGPLPHCYRADVARCPMPCRPLRGLTLCGHTPDLPFFGLGVSDAPASCKGRKNSPAKTNPERANPAIFDGPRAIAPGDRGSKPPRLH